MFPFSSETSHPQRVFITQTSPPVPSKPDLPKPDHLVKPTVWTQKALTDSPYGKTDWFEFSTKQQPPHLQTVFSQPPVPELLDYAALDPQLSPQEIQQYQQIEADWHNVMRGVEPGNLQGLISRIQQTHPHIQLEVLPPPDSQEQMQDDKLDDDTAFIEDDDNDWTDSDSDTDDLFAPDGNTQWNGKHATIQLSQKCLTGPDGIGFGTLAHELLHALHCANPTMRPISENDWLEEQFETIENHIYMTGLSNAANPFQQTFFKQQLSSLLKPFSIRVLRELKQGLRSEAVAYELASDFNPTASNRQADKCLAEGYRQSIRIINERIQLLLKKNDSAV